MSLPLLALLLTAALGLLALAWRRHGRRRQRAMSRVLDAADALEARLRGLRAELEAIGADPQPVHAALQEVLRQRLWLQQHGASAPVAGLAAVETAIAQANQLIDRKLNALPRPRTTTP